MTPDEYVARGLEIAPHPYCIPFTLAWRQQCHRWAWAVFGLQDERALHYSRAEMYYRVSCTLQWMHRHRIGQVGQWEFEAVKRARDARRDDLHPLHYEVCKRTFVRLTERVTDESNQSAR